MSTSFWEAVEQEVRWVCPECFGEGHGFYPWICPCGWQRWDDDTTRFDSQRGQRSEEQS